MWVKIIKKPTQTEYCRYIFNVKLGSCDLAAFFAYPNIKHQVTAWVIKEIQPASTMWITKNGCYLRWSHTEQTAPANSSSSSYNHSTDCFSTANIIRRFYTYLWCIASNLNSMLQQVLFFIVFLGASMKASKLHYYTHTYILHTNKCMYSINIFSALYFIQVQLPQIPNQSGSAWIQCTVAAAAAAAAVGQQLLNVVLQFNSCYFRI